MTLHFQAKLFKVTKPVSPHWLGSLLKGDQAEHPEVTQRLAERIAKTVGQDTYEKSHIFKPKGAQRIVFKDETEATGFANLVNRKVAEFRPQEKTDLAALRKARAEAIRTYVTDTVRIPMNPN